jgi:flavodoxin
MWTGKSLIAYFSRKGKNYVGGEIINLAVGNTEVVANMIGELTGGELFQIESVRKYPEEYAEATALAGQELRANARPKLAGHIEDIKSYEIVFLGYPNWWGTMPMPVFSFLEEYDFSGKTIAPFCTHEGSGLGRSLVDIKKFCPGTTVLQGLAIQGGAVRNSRTLIVKWLHDIGFVT